MKIRKLTTYTLDAAGQRQKGESAKFYAIFCGPAGRVHRIPLLESRDASRELGRTIGKLRDARATGASTLPADLTRALDAMPGDVRDVLAKQGIITGERAAQTKSLAEHLDDFKTALLAKGNTADYAALTAGRVQRIIDGCRFATIADVNASAVRRFIADIRQGTADASGISSASANYYLRDVKGFFRWMVRDGRASENPLEHLLGVKASAVKADKRERRALSADELRRLLDATATAQERYGMTGATRATLYRLAVETGLRAGELRSLTRASFALDGDGPSVTIDAAYSKNRRADTLPLRADTAAAMAEHVKGKMPAAQAFNVPGHTHTAKMFRADLADARAAYLAEHATEPARPDAIDGSDDFLAARDSAGRVVDFHALRHTFISNLAAAGVHPKTAQTLARHSTITLTMDRYTHVRMENLTAALDVLPSLDAPARQTVVATGTDGGGNFVSPPVSLNGGIRQNSTEPASVSGRATAQTKPPAITAQNAVFTGDSASEGDGARTRNHRIDNPVL